MCQTSYNNTRIAKNTLLLYVRMVIYNDCESFYLMSNIKYTRCRGL